MVFTLALGLTVILLELGLIAYAYERIGIDSRYLISLLALSLMGSNLNLPIARYDTEAEETAANVLAKFWAGEGFARAARSPRARGWGERLIRGQAAAWFNRTISAVLDDKGATA